MSPRSAPQRRLALSLSMCLIASSFAGCASRSSTREVQTVAASAASLKVSVPPLVRERCEGAELPPPRAGETDYQVFGVRQTGKLEKCDDKRALGVAAMDLHNTYVERLVDAVRPPTFWERIIGKRPRPPPKPTLPP